WRAAAFRAYVVANGLALHAVGATLPLRRGPLTESWQGTRGMRLALARAGFRDVATGRVGRSLVVTATAG
ncbi:hypothetical protein PYV61_17440, partial [Roseisolibacter sp. H3M3-2]